MERKFNNVEIIHQSQLLYDKFRYYMIALNKNTKDDSRIWKQYGRRGEEEIFSTVVFDSRDNTSSEYIIYQRYCLFVIKCLLTVFICCFTIS